jgi:hypothetical protein
MIYEIENKRDIGMKSKGKARKAGILEATPFISNGLKNRQ